MWEVKLTCGRRQRHKPNGNKMITKKWLNTNVIYAMNGQEGLMLKRKWRFFDGFTNANGWVLAGYDNSNGWYSI
jgi:hypothetical protein